MKNTSILKRCPKSKRIVGINYASTWFWIASPIIGILALIWFLVRVIPKPQRAQYPCQRVAASLAGGFLTYLAGILGASMILKKAKDVLKSRKFGAITMVSILASAVIFGAYSLLTSPHAPTTATTGGYASFTPPDATSGPVGIGKGIFPGRVVLARDASAVKYTGSGSWFSDANTDPAIVDNILKASIRTLTGKSDNAQGWEALFKSYNKSNTGVESGYQKGEKIVIKINLNQDKGQTWTTNHMPTPQLVYALVAELIKTAGADGQDITVMDASKSIGSPIYDRINASTDPELKTVRFVGQNRTKPQRSDVNPVKFSGDSIVDGYVPTDYINAKYMINVALFRGHGMFGVTLCGKNNFGSVDFDGTNMFVPIPMHGSSSHPYGSYSALVDLMGHKMMGGKTFLYMIDAFYGAATQGGMIKTNFTLFDGRTGSGIFVSQDPVAIDSVALDYLASEPGVDVKGVGSIPDNYLHEAAQAGNPPSGVRYNPNGDSSGLSSLGVHEHWNNAIDKQYARNLGESRGIEFLQLNLAATPAPEVVAHIRSLKVNSGAELKDQSVITDSGILKGTVGFTNNRSHTVTPRLVSALYEANGKLVSVSVTYSPEVLPTQTGENLTFSHPIASGQSGAKLRLFFWDGVTMEPLAALPTWSIHNQ